VWRPPPPAGAPRSSCASCANVEARAAGQQRDAARRPHHYDVDDALRQHDRADDALARVPSVERLAVDFAVSRELAR